MVKLALIFGGPSPEHDISIISARSVTEHINKAKYELALIYVAQDGHWYHLPSLDDSPDPQFGQQLTIRPEAQGMTVLSQQGWYFQPDVVFPLFHGSPGEDGTIQGLLSFMNVAYVGSGVLSTSLTMDKAMMKRYLASMNMSLPHYQWFDAQKWHQSPHKVWRALSEFEFPCFVKPVNLGSSLGITKVKNEQQWHQAIDCALRYDTSFLVEQGIEPARDIEIALLGANEPRISQPGEIVPDGEFYDYRAKYQSDDTQLLVPAPLSDDLVSEIQRLAREVYKLCHCYGMLRVDILLRKRDNAIFVSEANSIPGFTPISLYPRLWQLEGLSYTALIDQLVDLALSRSDHSAAGQVYGSQSSQTQTLS